MIKGSITSLLVYLATLTFLSSAEAIAGSYTTNFTSTENPISENGQWRNGQTDGVLWTNVRTTPGLVFGTQPGNGAGNALYADSTAVLTGTWGPNQSAQAVVVNTTPGGNLGIFEEVELRIHTTISANSITGYECNFSTRPASDNGQYAQIVRWNGPLGNPSGFTLLDSRAMTTILATGDVVRCRNSGSTITISRNGVDLFSVSDSTYVASGQGSPGVGFFLQNTTGVNSQYGFTSFTASDGADTVPPDAPKNLRVLP